MRATWFVWILGFLLAFGQLPIPPADAAEDSDRDAVDVEQELKGVRRTMENMEKILQRQNELIQKQQVRIEDLERRLIQPPAPPTPAGTRPGALPGQIGSLLPEIGLVGDITATSSEDAADTEGNDRISAREVELVIGSNVDPYSRFDATLTFSDFEDAGVEEAYLTRWGLPGDLTARFGRFFPKVGKQASIHRDSLPTVDEPLVINRYFGVEGYNRTGVDVTRIFEGIGGWLFQPSFGVLEGGVGERGTAFGSTRRRPTIYSHLKAYKDLSDASGIELGATHLVGSKDADPQFEVNLFGLDATYLNHLTPTAKILLQSELFLQHRRENFSINTDTGTTTYFDRHPWGAYLLTDYRFAPRWSVGARADHVRLVNTAATSRRFDQGVSAFLTFYQSEWARWRLQYRHEERGPEDTDDAVFLQGTFAIGTHKHKIQ